jgi:hypothetical protein
MAHWLTELLSLHPTAGHVARLTVLVVETLWVWWNHQKRSVKRHRPTDRSEE